MTDSTRHPRQLHEALTLSDLARQAASMSKHPSHREPPRVLTPEQLHSDYEDNLFAQLADSMRTPTSPSDDDDVRLVENDSRHEMSLAELYRKGRQRGLIKPQRQYT